MSGSSASLDLRTGIRNSTASRFRPAVQVVGPIALHTTEEWKQHFKITASPENAQWLQEQFMVPLRGGRGPTTIRHRVDAALLARAPDLQSRANLQAGHDDFDWAMMTAADVRGTHAPGMLTETAADTGLALPKAAARQITVAERFLRANKWRESAHDRSIMELGPRSSGTYLPHLGGFESAVGR